MMASIQFKKSKPISRVEINMCVSPRKTLNLVDPRQPQHWSTFTHTRNVLPIPIMTQVEEHTNYQSQSH